MGGLKPPCPQELGRCIDEYVKWWLMMWFCLQTVQISWITSWSWSWVSSGCWFSTTPSLCPSGTTLKPTMSLVLGRNRRRNSDYSRGSRIKSRTVPSLISLATGVMVVLLVLSLMESLQVTIIIIIIIIIIIVISTNSTTLVSNGRSIEEDTQQKCVRRDVN